MKRWFARKLDKLRRWVDNIPDGRVVIAPWLAIMVYFVNDVIEPVLNFWLYFAIKLFLTVMFFCTMWVYGERFRKYRLRAKRYELTTFIFDKLTKEDST